MGKFRKNLLLANSSIYIALFILVLRVVPTQEMVINNSFAWLIGSWIAINIFGTCAIEDKKEKTQKRFILTLILEWVLILPFLGFVLLYLSDFYFHFSIKIGESCLKIESTIVTIFSIIIFFIVIYLIGEKSNFIKNKIKNDYNYFLESFRIPVFRLILFFGLYSIISISFKFPIDVVSAVSAILVIILDKDYSKLKNWETLTKHSDTDRAFKIEKEVFFNKVTVMIIASSTIIVNNMPGLLLPTSKSDKKYTFQSDINIQNLIIFVFLLIFGMLLLRYLDNTIKKQNNK